MRSSHTLEGYIKRDGEEVGRKKYEDICKSKALTLANFIRKYGEELGR